MKKFLISTSEAKKIEYINNINKIKVVVLFKKDKGILDELEHENFYYADELGKSIQFLDFQSKVMGKTLIIYDCLRYNKHNASTYNKLYQLTELTDDIIITSEFPFKFDQNNLFIPMRMLKVNKYHYLQWYDNDFMIETEDGETVQANSTETFFNYYKEYIVCDGVGFNYDLHNWECNEEELSVYEDKKRINIYEKKYTKIKLITSLQGTSNRFESKLEKLKSVIDKDKKSIVVTNWEVGNKRIKDQIGECIIPISYHTTEIDSHGCGDVYFFESIINQKIHFYDFLHKFFDKKLHFFVNDQLGADRNATTETVDIVNDINEFYSYGWETF